MVMPKSYDDLLARLMAERENKTPHTTVAIIPKALFPEESVHKHTIMTESETAQEVAKTTEGVFETKGRRTVNYSIAADGNTVNMVVSPGLHPGQSDSAQLPHEIAPTGYMTTTGRLLKGKPGRKKGWRKKSSDAPA
jgi:hypothetical protein